MREIFLKNLNTKIYIDDISVVNEKDFDGKIRVYDSNKNYLEYYEETTFWYRAEENGTTFEQELNLEINEIENAKTIYCLLDNIGVLDYDIIEEYDMEEYDYINLIGEYIVYINY